MDLINRSIARSTGQDPRLNVFEAPSLGAVYPRTSSGNAASGRK